MCARSQQPRPASPLHSHKWHIGTSQARTAELIRVVVLSVSVERHGPCLANLGVVCVSKLGLRRHDNRSSQNVDLEHTTPRTTRFRPGTQPPPPGLGLQLIPLLGPHPGRTHPASDQAGRTEQLRTHRSDQVTHIRCRHGCYCRGRGWLPWLRERLSRAVITMRCHQDRLRCGQAHTDGNPASQRTTMPDFPASTVCRSATTIAWPTDIPASQLFRSAT